jgi:hypothetical protein
MSSESNVEGFKGDEWKSKCGTKIQQFEIKEMLTDS